MHSQLVTNPLPGTVQYNFEVSAGLRRGAMSLTRETAKRNNSYAKPDVQSEWVGFLRTDEAKSVAQRWECVRLNNDKKNAFQTMFEAVMTRTNSDKSFDFTVVPSTNVYGDEYVNKAWREYLKTLPRYSLFPPKQRVALEPLPADQHHMIERGVNHAVEVLTHHGKFELVMESYNRVSSVQLTETSQRTLRDLLEQYIRANTPKVLVDSVTMQSELGTALGDNLSYMQVEEFDVCTEKFDICMDGHFSPSEIIAMADVLRRYV